MFGIGMLASAIRRRVESFEPGPRGRRFRAGVEGLEGRALLSKGLSEIPIKDPGSSLDSVFAITRGPDGNVWFDENTDTSGVVGKITPAGAVTYYKVPEIGQTWGRSRQAPMVISGSATWAAASARSPRQARSPSSRRSKRTG